MNRHCLHVFLGGCLLAGFLRSPLARAAPAADAVVDGVLPPAWIERQGTRQTLAPGLVLQNRDRVITGTAARVRIRLRDGSNLHLAADTRLELNALSVRAQDVFTAALDVPQGAVRFTTEALARSIRQRAVNLRVGSITASIRGTDLWGQADAEGDRICLLEGSITVLHPNAEALQIAEAASCYRADPGDRSPALETVSAGQLSWWSALTAMPATASRSPVTPAASAYVRRGGSWAIELATLDSEAAALSLYDRARGAGYPVRIKPVARAGGGYDYSIRLGQLASQAEAANVAVQMARSLQIAPPVAMRQ
ncbi:MAG: FecR domain-containing protein [Candidatus Accumulibacter sp.]|jgi:cell division septation protein DedD|uniref:FecR domain-containing protein n=1 Tax=Accumulibacter sp. TaxID=2053492 RepID=UPI001A60FD79|nr:FecR domain-containing protein [Accumulibacter sp.]MBL8396412.1 FecR domain-containing protein [Accumulibacter sp.]